MKYSIDKFEVNGIDTFIHGNDITKYPNSDNAASCKSVKEVFDNCILKLDNDLNTLNINIVNFQESVINQINNYKPIEITGDVNNAPDEEDLTSNSNNLLQLKNRNNLNGMGYIILRQNKTFEEQLTQTNTIYEIRYDFDLNNQVITVPDNCVLKFEGGRLKNGTLCGNGTIYSSLVPIFVNMHFLGEMCCQQYEIDWFITQYTEYLNEEMISSGICPDATIELLQMFDSGALKFNFNNNKFLQVSSTLHITKPIEIVGTKQQRGSARNLNTCFIPCIYTLDEITIIKYTHTVGQEGLKRPCFCGLSLTCFADYSNSYQKNNTPILHIYSANLGEQSSMLWGIHIDLDITNVIRYVNGNGYSPNMVGILLETSGNGSYITYVDIDGYIQGCIIGIQSKILDKAWITSVTDNSHKNWCLQVCDMLGVSPILINGQNQCVFATYKPDTSTPFLIGDNITLNGILWDVPITHIAVKSYQFTNNCPTFMGLVHKMGTIGFTDYYISTIPELPYIGKNNNILEGLTDNASAALSTHLFDDVYANDKNFCSIITDYDIELFNENESTSIKGTLNDELNIFNNQYFGSYILNSGKHLNTNYNNTFNKIYSQTSLRYTFTLSKYITLDYNSYILTHTADFEKCRIIVEFRNSSDSLLNRQVINEFDAQDYYRNTLFTQLGVLKGTGQYECWLTGYTKIIIEYINCVGVAICPPIGIFNSTYKGFGVSGGNVVGRANLQDIIHATPSTTKMDVYYIYNKHYGQSKLLTSAYQRLFRCKYRYFVNNQVYFSFRSNHYWNYIEIKGQTPTSSIGDKDITIKVDIYRENSLIYIDVYGKSTKDMRIDFGKMFSNFGVEFISDDISIDLEPTITKELKSDYHNKHAVSSTSTDKIIKITYTPGALMGFIKGGRIQEPSAVFINCSSGFGQDSGKPINIIVEHLGTWREQYGIINVIAYHNPKTYENVIELTQYNVSYTTPSIYELFGNVISTQSITTSEYDSTIHTNYVNGKILNKYNSGNTENRPQSSNIMSGYMYLDTTLNKPIWWTGDKWVDAIGTEV